ncbi:hypothetical protein VFPBJ_11634 [Purpureocillium lilacinum]|uniref:Uncharacterized protein n=1 Tax=Purpureocillium lilacinum TaxID=33203 RepID=A0A179F0W3_PURLI|nr:hypothetical protein VFPBJ_11634 [Purpureocillium lilacinum]
MPHATLDTDVSISFFYDTLIPLYLNSWDDYHCRSEPPSLTRVILRCFSDVMHVIANIWTVVGLAATGSLAACLPYPVEKADVTVFISMKIVYSDGLETFFGRNIAGTHAVTIHKTPCRTARVHD